MAVPALPLAAHPLPEASCAQHLYPHPPSRLQVGPWCPGSVCPLSTGSPVPRPSVEPAPTLSWGTLRPPPSLVAGWMLVLVDTTDRREVGPSQGGQRPGFQPQETPLAALAPHTQPGQALGHSPGRLQCLPVGGRGHPEAGSGLGLCACWAAFPWRCLGLAGGQGGQLRAFKVAALWLPVQGGTLGKHCPGTMVPGAGPPPPPLDLDLSCLRASDLPRPERGWGR